MGISTKERQESRAENIELNNREFLDRALELKSWPRLVTLGTHNSCNAKCIFCLEGNYQRFSLQLYKDFFEAKMGPYIRNAEKVTFTGFGEILWVPGIEDFLDYINETLPDQWKIFTTNATPLRPSVMERLLKSRYVIQASVHASNAKLHKELTLLDDSFDLVFSNLKKLADLRDEKDLGRQLHIELINVINTRNVDDLSDFIKMAWRLRVQEVKNSYVTMFAPEHIELSCFFEQERANASLEKARETLSLLEKGELLADLPRPNAFSVNLPPSFNSGEAPVSSNEELCYDPWQHIYVELQGPVIPCCNWGGHIGNLKKGDDLDTIWNGEFYQGLRKGMGSGDPNPWCKSCMRYRGYNVNSIFSHLTNRPRQQAVLLKEIMARGLHAGSYFKPEDLAQLEASEL